jgi:hypothetical protein
MKVHKKVYSGWGFFFDTSALPMPIVRTDKGTWCAAQESLSFFQYIHHCREEAHMGPVNSISEICWGLLFNSCARNNHRIAILTGFILALCIFNEFDGTYWVGRTLAASWKKMWTFIVFFIVVITGFAFLFYTRFSHHFEQFSTLSMSFYTLICFSFSVPYPIEEGMDPFSDNDSKHLVVYYLGYSIAVLSLALNFFTTIILDAYADIKDDSWKPWWEMSHEWHAMLATWVFPGVEDEMKDDEAAKQQQIKILARIPKSDTVKVRKAPVRRAAHR